MYRTILLFFVFSGATSLTLETAWVRGLRLILGNTSACVAAVLSAFMAGLALGGWLGGCLADRPRPLRTYGLLEGISGAYCLALPPILQFTPALYRAFHVHLEQAPWMLNVTRFLLCALLLAVPAVFMGATLPVLSRFAAYDTRLVGRPVGHLYAANSIGAAAGAFLCGFVLLPWFGVNWTMRLACAVNLAICCLTILLDRSSRQDLAFANHLDEHGPDRVDKWEFTKRDVPPTPLLLAMYGLSGAAALACEVAWTRVLTLIIGSSAYAFSLMLSVFILGLAVGSAAVSRWVDRWRNLLAWFGGIQYAIALTVLAGVILFGGFPIIMVGLVRQWSDSFWQLQAVEFVLLAGVILAPTLFMGAAFPVISRVLADTELHAGAAAGKAYAANTVGAIFGSVLTTFVMIPRIGSQYALVCCACAYAIIGLVCLGGHLRVRLYRAAAVMGGIAAWGAVALLAGRSWDPAIMSSGAYLYAAGFPRDRTSAADIRSVMMQAKVLYHREDAGATVTVREDSTGERLLAVNGKSDASLRGDLSTQLLLAHAPLLLHPEPREALVIGLASGITLGAASRYPLERIDCVEISPAVVEASSFFEEGNYQVLKDPRVRLIVGDGRNHLALTDRVYDVIISEPSNPWMAGVADLFTLEFFESCRQHLRPGGLACIWLQAYELDDPIFRTVVRTLTQALPHVVMVEAIPFGDYLLIGSSTPIRLSADALASKCADPRIAGDLERIGIRSPLDFLAHLISMNLPETYAGSGPAHTDDNALLEYAAPRTLYRTDLVMQVVSRINQYRSMSSTDWSASPTSAVPELMLRAKTCVEARRLAVDALLAWRHGSHEWSYDLARKASMLDPVGSSILIPHAEGLLRRAEQATQCGDWNSAVQLAGVACRLAPTWPEACSRLAPILVSAGKWREAVDTYRRAVELGPSDLSAANNLAWLLAVAPEDAVRNGGEALLISERLCRITKRQQPVFLRTLAAAHAELGHFDEAVMHADEALRLVAAAPEGALPAQIKAQLALYRAGKLLHLSASH
jgi:spermidine synthase